MTRKIRNLYAQGSIRAEKVDEDTGRVFGTAIRFGQAGHFPWGLVLRVKTGAATDALAVRSKSTTRDVVLLKAHQPGSVLGRQANGKLQIKESARRVTYSATLNLRDPEALSVFEKVDSGDYTAASIGFMVFDSENVKAVDDSPDADPDTAGEEIDMLEATEIDIYEISVLAQGAFGDATTMAARAYGRHVQDRLADGFTGSLTFAVDADSGELTLNEGTADAAPDNPSTSPPDTAGPQEVTGGSPNPETSTLKDETEEPTQTAEGLTLGAAVQTHRMRGFATV